MSSDTRLARQRRYEVSPKGRDTQRRYNDSARGLLRKVLYRARSVAAAKQAELEAMLNG